MNSIGWMLLCVERTTCYINLTCKNKVLQKTTVMHTNKVAMPEGATCVDIQSEHAFLVPHSTYLMSHSPTSQESSIRYPEP